MKHQHFHRLILLLTAAFLWQGCLVSNLHNAFDLKSPSGLILYSIIGGGGDAPIDEVTDTDRPWVQDAYLKASNTGAGDSYGVTVDIDGDYAIVGAPYEINGATSINNIDNASITDEGANGFGAAYVFKRDPATGDWIQDAYLKPSNFGGGFGWGVSISGDYAVVGAPNESNSATTIHNSDNAVITDEGTAYHSGAAYIFKRDPSTGEWIQDAYLKASNAGAKDEFGRGVAINGDYAIVGARGEDNSSTSINNADNASSADAGTAENSGAAYIFKRDPVTGDWIQDAYLKASNAGTGDGLGWHTLSINGDFAIVGAPSEANSSRSINNVDNAIIADDDDGTTNSGAAYIFKRDPTTGDWIQDAYLKASHGGGLFGFSVSLSENQTIVAARGDLNSFRGIDNVDNGSIADDETAPGSGAAYIFNLH